MNIKIRYLTLALGVFLSLYLVACSSSGDMQASSAPLDLHILKRGNYPDAVCIDGTPGAFAYRRGQDEGANKWVFVLQGGGVCTSRESCESRNKQLRSSITWRNKSTEEISVLMDGILNPSPKNNPNFYNWNHVFFIYCSGDGWTGQRLASSETEGINWVGHFILKAIVDTLQDQSIIGSPTLASAEDILFAGSSAGAGGVRSNIDWLAEYLLSNQIDAKFRGVLDSGLGPLSRPDETIDSSSARRNLTNSFVNQNCFDAHAETSDAGRCADTEYLLVNDYISTPLFVYQDQSDYSLMSSYGGEIRARIQNIITALPNAFSPDQGKHFLITKANFYRMTVEYPSEFIAGYENSLYLEEGVRYSYADVLWLWYSQDAE